MFSAVPAFADELTLFGGQPISGDYAVYRDASWSDPTWIGFLYYDESTWGVFLKAPSRSADVRILFRAESSEGKLILTGQQIVSSITQNDVDAVNYLMGLLPDLYAWSVSARQELADKGDSPGSTAPVSATGSGSGTVNIDRACAMAKNGIGSRPDRSPLLPPLATTERDGSQFGGAVALDWAAELPVFSLAALRTASGTDILTLERIGRVGQKGDSAFFSFTPLEYRPTKDGPATAANAGTGATAVKAATAEIRVVDGLSLALDGNWTMVADNTFFMGDRAMVIVDRLDAAALGLFPREKNLPLALVKLFALSGDTASAFPPETKLSGSSDRFEIQNVLFDGQTSSFNRDIKLCVPVRDASGALEGIVIANLSVKDELYRSNRAYFDSLF